MATWSNFRKCPSWFRKALKRIDDRLECRWDGELHRWRVVRRVGALGDDVLIVLTLPGEPASGFLRKLESMDTRKRDILAELEAEEAADMKRKRKDRDYMTRCIGEDFYRSRPDGRTMYFT
ncbi:MAG TPA: hypothetical protein PLL10_00205 [Elusimicrobiales bacterium]|nr:hypothetical protein [Elusimicrobiales bacterium]